MNNTRTTGLSSARPAMLRSRPLILASVLATGVAIAGVRYNRAQNERAQRGSETGAYHVRVERSGGGI
ncbi:hypothetical protein GGR57DRAFT_103043 [Xylariaceae sp. FL1272]|nr:hypothetical protein GGR57DRAFT_103043 [Xylariaceae sp. FL1272]